MAATEKDKPVESGKDKKTGAKTATTTSTTPTMAKQEAPQPTPATPSASKILDQVRTKGTLKTASPRLDKTSSGTSSSTERPSPPWLRKPSSSPPPPPLPSSQQRTTTIPLPKKPSQAPSPIIPTRSSQQHQKQNNPYPSYSSSSSSYTRTSQRPAHPAHLPRPAPQSATRIIEPTPDMRLPPKYRPAARRVTAIMVALPIVIVFGYELFARWRGKEVKKRFADREV